MDGMEYQVVRLIFLTSLAGLVILGAFLLLAIKMIQGGSRRKRVTLEEETRMIQEIYQGLRRMERRVEALETILFDRE